MGPSEMTRPAEELAEPADQPWPLSMWSWLQPMAQHAMAGPGTNEPLHSWWHRPEEAGREAKDASASLQRVVANNTTNTPTHAKKGQAEVKSANAQSASRARKEREERKAFREEQKAKMRQRGAALRARQAQRTPMEEEMLAKRWDSKGGHAAGAPRIISLGALSSADRAEVAKILWSPVLNGGKEFNYFDTGKERYLC